MKTTKIKFKIGEFSKPNRITVKTLRHYKEIGPLGPEQADKRTGYPYYGACQLGRMNTIRHLKGPGFTIQIPAVRQPRRHTLSDLRSLPVQRPLFIYVSKFSAKTQYYVLQSTNIFTYLCDVN